MSNLWIQLLDTLISPYAHRSLAAIEVYHVNVFFISLAVKKYKCLTVNKAWWLRALFLKSHDLVGIQL
jgi:hypothetical protein